MGERDLPDASSILPDGSRRRKRQDTDAVHPSITPSTRPEPKKLKTTQGAATKSRDKTTSKAPSRQPSATSTRNGSVTVEEIDDEDSPPPQTQPKPKPKLKTSLPRPRPPPPSSSEESEAEDDDAELG